MSFSDGSESSEKPQRPPEVLEDNVSLISVVTGCDQFKSIAIRVILAVIFLGLGIGAIVYSVTTSEAEWKEPPNITDTFNVLVNQMCDNGTWTIERILANFTGEDIYETFVVTIGTSWIQDHDTKRLYHRVGLKDEDWEYTIYVHENYTVKKWAEHGVINCTVNYAVNYMKYMDHLGLKQLKRSGKEQSIWVNGAYVPVVVYMGAPPSNMLVHGVHPNLLIAYTNPQTGAAYGWETYFPRSNKSDLFRTEYWFPDMIDIAGDQSIFTDYPPNCVRDDNPDIDPISYE